MFLTADSETTAAVFTLHSNTKPNVTYRYEYYGVDNTVTDEWTAGFSMVTKR